MILHGLAYDLRYSTTLESEQGDQGSNLFNTSIDEQHGIDCG